jgi:hypothetical protein
MNNITLSIKVVELFFDRPAVLNRMDAASAKALAKAGAFVRRAARSRLRRRKRVSLPGESPSVHSKDPIANLKFILFAFDGRQSVVIGPVGLNQRQYLDGQLLAGTVPNLMEFGGRAGIREKLENLIPPRAKKRRGQVKRKLTEVQIAAIIRKKQQTTPSYQPGEKWVRMGRHKPLPGQPVRIRLAVYAPRPFMAPALKQEEDKFPSLWARSIAA